MDSLLSNLLAEPSGEFDNFVRTSCNDFEYILQKISPIIAKKDTYISEKGNTHKNKIGINIAISGDWR